MHIPKSAGTSLTEAMRAALNPRTSVLRRFDQCLFGDFRDFENMPDIVRQAIFRGPDQLEAGCDFVAGHLSWTTTHHAYPSAQFMTVLREPVSRLLSHWLFWRSLTDDQLAPWGREWIVRLKQSRQPLRSFITAPNIASQTDNIAVRMLLWPHPLIPDGDFIDERHDETLRKEALARLNRFSFVNFLENPRLAGDISDWLKCPLTIPNLNETPALSTEFATDIASEIGGDTRRLLELRSRLDGQLWQHAAAIWYPDLDTAARREEIFAKNASRFARVMAGETVGAVASP